MVAGQPGHGDLLMSDKKDTGTDRRTLLAVAAAAGVAAAGSASAFNPQPDPPGDRVRLPTQIKIDLGGARLPERVATELQSQINRDVLAALARAGIKGNVVRPGNLGPGIYGIIYRPVAINAGRPG